MWGDMYLFLHLQLTWDLRTNLSYVQGNINQEGEQVKKKITLVFQSGYYYMGSTFTVLTLFCF